MVIKRFFNRWLPGTRYTLQDDHARKRANHKAPLATLGCDLSAGTEDHGKDRKIPTKSYTRYSDKKYSKDFQDNPTLSIIHGNVYIHTYKQVPKL